jgi:hypothetical protein
MKTMIPDAAERAGMTFRVHLTGPGGKILDRDFGPQGGTVELQAGPWRITVKAYNSEPRLRGITDQIIQVKPGESQIIMVTSAIGVRNETDLLNVMDTLTGTFLFNDPNTANNNLVVVENDFDLNAIIDIDSGRKYTIIAEPETTRTIRRVWGGISISYGSSLILGRAGEAGTLIFDGLGVDPGMGAPFIQAHSGGAVIIDGSTEIRRMVWSTNRGAAILVLGGSSLELKSGKVSDCVSEYGGAICVEGAGNTFTMSGGEIGGNEASGATTGNGGGVEVSDGAAFTMNGGVINGNRARVSGGGVHLDRDAVFIMTGGAINGNAVQSSTGYGGGVLVDTGVSFTMTGGVINGNTAPQGGGVAVQVGSSSSPTGTFIMTGGVISGNSTPSSGSGGGVYAGIRGIFAKRGGTITGNNTAGTGPMAYTTLFGGKVRTTEAGPGVRLYVDVAGNTYIDPLDSTGTANYWM